MKLKLKIMCAVLALVGVCLPAFSANYAATFKQVMNVEPEKASVAQLKEFYERYSAGKEEKAQLIQEMASWQHIYLYKAGMPSVEFLDFVLTIENKLSAEEDSILVPIYKNSLNLTTVDTSNKNWSKQVDQVLGDKSIQVKGLKMRSSWVARGAVFQAVLQHCVEQKYCYPVSGYVLEGIDIFAVKNVLFGANSKVRKELMRTLLRNATKAVAEGAPAVVETSSSRYSTTKLVHEAGSKENFHDLLSLEKIIKSTGGDGLDPADPNWKKIQAGRSKVTSQVIVQRLKVMWKQGTITGLNVHTNIY